MERKDDCYAQERLTPTVLWAHYVAVKAKYRVRRELGPEPKIPEHIRRAAEAIGWKFN